ncbi:TetR family transcriptional regulator [Desulfallas sp. Bu1-1]|uniref:TetR/AcrR family transcriptional regulator n=1 Tax=Desulfallas sp. Bu1-1 TaxID=2787620 RepID=UPI00189E895D|nr:TetR/AcrR family transcriptional regulator [Desulfallas sp. Bu1-1]MBF7082268.1 TetR family transcriptional regulator [Desulfallas sp. Bu1-1]
MNFREARAAERRLNILKAAAKLFSEKGYHDATIEEIARELKYTKGSIYYYINSKQDLLFQCHELAMNLLLDNIYRIRDLGLAPDLMLKEVIKGHIETLMSEFNLVTVMLVSDYELEEEYARIIINKRDEYEGIIAGIIRDGIEKAIFRDVPVKVVINLIMGAANWIGRWFRPEGPMTLQEISQFYADYLVEPLLVRDKSRE